MDTQAISWILHLVQAIKEYYSLIQIDTDFAPLSICSSVMNSCDKQIRVIIELFKNKHNKTCWIIDEIVRKHINGVYWYNRSYDKDKFIITIIYEIDSEINYRCK